MSSSMNKRSRHVVAISNKGRLTGSPNQKANCLAMSLNIVASSRNQRERTWSKGERIIVHMSQGRDSVLVWCYSSDSIHSCVSMQYAERLAMPSNFFPMRRLSSQSPPITCVSSRCLRLPDNLHHIPSSQPEVPRHRVVQLDSRKLRLLQPIPLQQTLLLLRAE